TTKQDSVAAYTSRARPMCAAILLWAGPNTIPGRYHPDRANRVLHSRHDPTLLRAERLPSAIGAVRRPVQPASDKEWPDDKAPSSPRLDARHLHSPKYSIRLDDYTRLRREIGPTS